MKKIIFTILLAVFALSTTACSMMFADPEYNYQESYAEDYAYLDEYAQVNWNDAQYDIQYSYYDESRVFLIIYGSRIYIIPYEYFYHYIYPRFRMRIIWRSYDYLCGMWGWQYYNGLWNHWHYRHYRSYWRPRYDYYTHHRNNNNNRPFIIRKNELRQNPNVFNKGIKHLPRLNISDNNRARIFTPKRTTERNYHYIPRFEKSQIQQRLKKPGQRVHITPHFPAPTQNSGVIKKKKK